MNGYSLIYWPPDNAPQVSVNVRAYSFEINKDFVLFIDQNGSPIMAVPVTLNPVVALTA